jgi:hypothetical protein
MLNTTQKLMRSKPAVIRFAILGTLALSVCPSSGDAQTTSLPSVERALQTRVRSPEISAYQMQQFLMRRIPPLPHAGNAQAWAAEAEHLRSHTLRDVAFHGWPSQWVSEPAHFEQTGVIEAGHGYRIRKLRYEIVPGFQSTALLYEPVTPSGRIPAILNVLGHEPAGTAAEYEQKRSINFAKRGMIALDLQWPAFGELNQLGNRHDYAAQLNLVGLNSLGFFYLAMLRGLDYLSTLPQVDSIKIGMTGLSGGGWQTVLLSALDKRIAVSVEVAGVGSRESNLTRPHDTDEVEESSPDLMEGGDYPEFIAMRAPRPTLLVHDAVDSCCFRAPLVQPYIYENVKPFFATLNASDALQWHENIDPGTHNYQRDNREQAYRFFAREFHLPPADSEIFSDAEIATPQQLAVDLPTTNLTILDLARKLGAEIHREPVPANANARDAWVRSRRDTLQSVLRYQPVSTVQALRRANGLGLDFRYLAYEFGFSNGLSATGLFLKETSVPPHQPAIIILDDKGYENAANAVSEHVDRGEQVLALDLLFNGPEAAGYPDTVDWAMLADSTGARPLGLEVAQLIATTNWVRSTSGVPRVQVETNGIRSEVIALGAAAVAPDLFSGITSRNGMRSLSFLLDTPVPIRSAPELFCLDLYKEFDLDLLQTLAAPVKVTLETLRNQDGPWELKSYAP